MIIRKLRLERGWSQDQLAQISGLNIRTIQRIERGQTAGLDSLNALAASFGVPLTQLQPEAPMTTDTTIPNDKQFAQQQVNRIKKFYYHLGRYLVVMALLLTINLLTSPNYLWVKWTAMGWGFGVLIHALNTFLRFELPGGFLNGDWEKRKLEKLLNKKS